MADGHAVALAKLCRICGDTISGYSKAVSKCLSDLKIAFSKVDFKDDNELVHPQFICRTCYSALLNIKKRGITSSQEITLWKPHDSSCVACKQDSVKKVAGRRKKKKSPGRPKTVLSIADIMQLDASKQIPPKVEEALAHVISIKMKQSSDKSVQLKSSRGPPVTLRALTVARKDSTSVCKRTLYNRSRECKEVMSIVSGNDGDALAHQASHLVKSMEAKEREKIISSLGASTLSVVPADNVAAMKGTLNLTWNKLRDIRRWLATFNVKLASEKKSRLEAADIRGEGLVAEMAPLIVDKGKGKPMEVKPIPWCYLYNLVGHALNRLKQLKELQQINMHHINEIHVKIGGDHGGGSFKMCYEICNVNNPNSKENTVVFSIFEEKDSRANLRTCLERFRTHVNQLNKITWEGYRFRVFMFGDYQYLGYMFGLSGASARHSCLWCLATADEMQLPSCERVHVLKRTLQSIKEDFQRFVADGKDLKRAKFFNNVIDEVFFDIDLIQVCCPGLHLTLGIVLKMFNMMENYALSCDIEIALMKARCNDATLDDSFAELIQQIGSLKTELQELEASYTSLQDERNWILISGEERDRDNIVDQYDIMLRDIQLLSDKKQREMDKLISKSKVDLNNGPCVVSLDETLKSMGVERQPYYGKCLVGNACHTILKPQNIKLLCDAIPNVVMIEANDVLLHATSVDICDKFRKLLSLYSSCDTIFNSSTYLEDDIIDILSQNIIEFMKYFRTNWPGERITPKMHILEDHLEEFTRKWKMGCGFYGEQGGEAIHQEFNKMSRAYNNITNKLDRLKYKMDMHMLSTAPKAVDLKVDIKPRTLKRKMTE